MLEAATESPSRARVRAWTKPRVHVTHWVRHVLQAKPCSLMATARQVVQRRSAAWPSLPQAQVIAPGERAAEVDGPPLRHEAVCL